MNAVCTIVAKNFYARAIALGDSLKRYHPEIYFHILLVDEDSEQFNVSEQIYPTIEFKNIGIPRWEDMAFQYDITELCTATKPFFMEYLFNKFGYNSLLYLDPDTYIYDDINEIFTILEEKFIILTPHITDINKASDCFIPDKSFLLTGVYNLGFIGLSCRSESFELLNWWKNRLTDQCYNDTIESLFVDQKWMNFITCFFDKGIYIMRDPGYNISYWNIHERVISKDKAGYIINGKYRLKIMHFSNIGIEPEDFSIIAKYEYNGTIGFCGYPELFKEYSHCVVEAGNPVFSNMPYKYRHFSDGKLIYNIHRRLFRILTMQGKNFVNPFSSEGHFYSLLKRNGLICDEETVPNVISRKNYSDPDKQIVKLFRYLRIFTKVFGIQNYLKLKKVAWFLQKDVNQIWLIGDIESRENGFLCGRQTPLNGLTESSDAGPKGWRFWLRKNQS